MKIEHTVWGKVSRASVDMQCKVIDGVVHERQFDWEEWKPRPDLTVVVGVLDDGSETEPYTWPKAAPLGTNGFTRKVVV